MGNHEIHFSRMYVEEYNEYINSIEKLGVNILLNEQVEIQNKNKEHINLFGIDELYNYSGDYTLFGEVIDSLVQNFRIPDDEFNILLAHHPEQLETYSDYSFDLVFSGHAHGGQVRIFGQGIIAPNQGVFPEYTSGLYEMNGTQLVVSRGIGNSRFPLRLFNRPHLIITELKTEK